MFDFVSIIATIILAWLSYSYVILIGSNFKDKSQNIGYKI